MAEGYDFIIVGGGSAGSVLAARLSENPDARVLLLEAGPRDWHPFYHMPAGFAKMTKGIGSWGWQTVPQKHMKGMMIRYTQARVLGGGSTVNAQLYTRGNALDHDEWRQSGCKGWSYEDVLPYFRKSEDNDTYDNRYHGQGGPLGGSQPAAALPICKAYFKAAGQLGIPRNRDMTGERQDGVGYYQLTQRDVRRSSASIAFLSPARHRPNLTVRTKAQVIRVVIEAGRAIGVELARKGMIRHIVLVRFRPEVRKDTIQAIFADLHAIKGRIPELGPIHTGRSESPEAIERGHLHGFTVDFDDWQALAAYQDHPDHRRVGGALVAHAVGGLDGILVFDLPFCPE